MLKPILFSALCATSIVAQTSFAKTTEAECSLEHEGKTEWVRVKLDQNGKITQWDETQWAKASKDAYWFGVFAENIEEYGFEWDNSFKARNGYAILELGTTADAFKLGVNLKAGKGFFQYFDHGSGSGDFGPVATTCKKL